MDFEVIVDCSFLDIDPKTELTPVENKRLISLINDFEDGCWRYSKFQNFIWDNIAETSLSQKERESLFQQPQTLLTAAAKNLKLSDSDQDIGKGSELAEIVLYGIMKHHFGAIPVVPKIFYKQNSNDNAKGADSVHIVLEDDGQSFSLWFGEAKFFNSIEDARLPDVISSVGKSLDTNKLKKENSIICNVSDLEYVEIDAALREQIIEALSPRHSIDSLKPILNIPILLLHECRITNDTTELSEQYKEDIVEHHKDRTLAYYKKQIETLSNEIFRYSEIKFHLILFPVPKKDLIVDKFVENARHHQEQ